MRKDMAEEERKQWAYAYCENEAAHGYYCNDPDCPHCPYYKGLEGDEK